MAQLVAEKDGLLWKVKLRGAKGAIPKALQTGFTSKGTAEKAIKLFREGVENKAKNKATNKKVKLKEG